MKIIASIRLLVATIAVVFASCERNDTIFIEDDDAEDLSIFSDNGNNVMTCYINGKPFRTRDRIEKFGFNGRNETELYLFKDDSATDADTLTIMWQTDLYSPDVNSVSLVLPVKKFFSHNDFYLFSSKRMEINGVNGYFIINGNRSEKGTGNIYFQRANLQQNDSEGRNSWLSGIFEATLPSYKITRGRFDHSLSSEVVAF